MSGPPPAAGTEFRQLEPGDGPAFRRLLRELDDGTAYMLFEPGERNDDGDGQFVDRIRGMNDNGTVIGAFDHGELVGYVSGRVGGARRIRHALHLVLGVLPSHQGRHVGTGLMESVEAWAGDHAVTRLELTVVTVNEPAVGLYLKAGYVIEGTLRGSMVIGDRPHDEYAMAKFLG
ncbi:MAG: GNAT family N-acetyltransferase [Mycobacteriaceae bacterium]|uniref:GNAT family N-acetyltransferase n=1 Tax=Corynebacterium sp. TaxID=1720 RepID=UPI003F9D5F4B